MFKTLDDSRGRGRQNALLIIATKQYLGSLWGGGGKAERFIDYSREAIFIYTLFWRFILTLYFDAFDAWSSIMDGRTNKAKGLRDWTLDIGQWTMDIGPYWKASLREGFIRKKKKKLWIFTTSVLTPP